MIFRCVVEAAEKWRGLSFVFRRKVLMNLVVSVLFGFDLLLQPESLSRTSLE